MEKKAAADGRPIFAELVELARDVAAEGLHGAKLGRELGGKILDATLGAGAADELRTEATAQLVESADALRRAIAANVALARSAVAVQGRALDWTVALVEGWLAGKGGAAAGSGEPRPRHDREERRARLATFLRVIDGWRGQRPSQPAAPVAPQPADAQLHLGADGGATSIHLLNAGPDEVRARFHVGPCVRDGGGAPFRVHVTLEPEELTLRPGVEEPVRVTVGGDARFEAGASYRLPIVVAGLGTQVIVHLVGATKGPS